MEHINLHKQLPIRVPDLLLPSANIDLHRWACIACDQFTSSPNYWDSFYAHIHDAPSTAKLIAPEAYFNKLDSDDFKSIKRRSVEYLESGILTPKPNSSVLVKRQTSAGIRTGIILEIDLAQYRLDPNEKGAVFATEMIVPERIAMRVQARKNSILDISHVLVLYHDIDNSISTLLEPSTHSSPLYDFSLYDEGGSIKGYALSSQMISLAFNKWYQNAIEQRSPSYFLAGDGNHSLVAAKTLWQERGAAMDDPHRWALVELVNIFDPGLPVLPIHRISLATTKLNTVQDTFGHNLLKRLQTDPMVDMLAVDIPPYSEENFYLFLFGKTYQVYIKNMDTASAIEYFDTMLMSEIPKGISLDFVHNVRDVKTQAKAKPQLPQILCPKIDGASLFKVRERGKLLPRKCFSLGKDSDKRYYLELRSLA